MERGELRAEAYIHYRKFPWYPKHLYEKYAPIIGSATAQQIINKNSEAWRSFFSLKKLECEGKLPDHITKISMPRYWKKNGKRELRIVAKTATGLTKNTCKFLMVSNRGIKAN